MGEIMGGGLNEFPYFRFADEKMSVMFRRLLQSPDLDPRLKDPQNWPAGMREEYGDDRGVTAARIHHDKVTAAFRTLRAAIDDFDGGRAHELLDRLIASYTIETVLRDVVLPYLRELGDRWARGETTPAHEHFASSLLEGRLLGLGRGWDRGSGPRALLACPSGERHTLGLIAFGLALRRQGWRITYLGAETPPDHLVVAAETVDPAVLVLAGVAPEPLVEATRRLRQLDARRRVLVGGAAAASPAAAKAGWETLGQDPVAAAAELAASA